MGTQAKSQLIIDGVGLSTDRAIDLWTNISNLFRMPIHILHRYLWGSVIRGYLPVLAILLAVFSLFVFVEEVDEVGNGRYTLWTAGEFVLLTLPERLVVLSPFIALLGSIMALGGLANGRELLAMQAAGISHYRIAGTVMQVGLVFVVIRSEEHTSELQSH